MKNPFAVYVSVIQERKHMPLLYGKGTQCKKYIWNSQSVIETVTG